MEATEERDSIKGVRLTPSKDDGVTYARLSEEDDGEGGDDGVETTTSPWNYNGEHALPPPDQSGTRRAMQPRAP